MSSEPYERKKARFVRAQISSTSISLVNDRGYSEKNAENKKKDVEIQTDETAERTTRQRNELSMACAMFSTLKYNIERLQPFSVASLHGQSNQYIIHYTGLPKFKFSNLSRSTVVLRT